MVYRAVYVSCACCFCHPALSLFQVCNRERTCNRRSPEICPFVRFHTCAGAVSPCACPSVRFHTCAGAESPCVFVSPFLVLRGGRTLACSSVRRAKQETANEKSSPASGKSGAEEAELRYIRLSVSTTARERRAVYRSVLGAARGQNPCLFVSPLGKTGNNEREGFKSQRDHVFE
jgi:hypothetical protein